MEIYLSMGVLALGTLSLLAVTSLPSIANSLNWKEFSFVQVKQISLERQLRASRVSCSLNYFSLDLVVRGHWVRC